MPPDPSTPAPALQPPGPPTIAGYTIQRILTPNTSFLAQGEAGRLVVLKRVDDDCILGKTLHPSIAERLARVREVAHAGVANLFGVEKDRQAAKDSPAWLVWEYVPGQTILQWAGQPDRTSRELLLMARELILSVDLLHMQGLVHGALIGGNVIIEPGGALRLTHVSPLLYTDMNVDLESVVALLKDLAQRCGHNGDKLTGVLERHGDAVTRGHHEADADGETRRQRDREAPAARLRELGARVAAALEGGENVNAGTRERGDAERKVGKMIAQIAAIALGGLAVAYGVWRAFER